MLKILAMFFLWPALMLGELPAKTLPISKPEVWIGYTRELAYREFPEEWRILDRVEFLLDSSLNPNARMEKTIRGHGSITVNLGIIFLLENEEEYFAILAHEIGHLKQRFRPTHIPCWTINEMLNPGIIEENPQFLTIVLDSEEYLEMEKEADDFSLNSLKRRGYDPCSFSNVLSRTLLAENDIIRYKRLALLCSK